jgi:VanZ family protein
MVWFLLATFTLGSGLFATRDWGRSPWRWLVVPQIALALLATFAAYLGRIPLWLVRWPYADKVLHFVLFGLVAVWLHLWLGRRTVQVTGVQAPLAILIPVALATVEEMSQTLSPLRSPDWLDWLCGVAGILVCLAISEQFYKRGSIAT